MIIVVSGTPGTGKTTVAMKLAEVLHYAYLDGNDVIQKYKLDTEYDEKRDCAIIDEQKFIECLKSEINNKDDIIIDSHLAHDLPKEVVDKVIITKCSLKLLEKRLKDRDYSEKKIRENLDAEIFDVCLTEATANEHSIITVQTDEVDLEDLKIRLTK